MKNDEEEREREKKGGRVSYIEIVIMIWRKKKKILETGNWSFLYNYLRSS